MWSDMNYVWKKVCRVPFFHLTHRFILASKLWKHLFLTCVVVLFTPGEIFSIYYLFFCMSRHFCVGVLLETITNPWKWDFNLLDLKQVQGWANNYVYFFKRGDRRSEIIKTNAFDYICLLWYFLASWCSKIVLLGLLTKPRICKRFAWHGNNSYTLLPIKLE